MFQPYTIKLRVHVHDVYKFIQIQNEKTAKSM